MPPQIGVTLDVHVGARRTADGGRSRPIVSGYRPLCVIDGADGETVIGMCILELDRPIAPGTSGDGQLSFDAAVSEEVRALLRVGSRFALAEGRRPIADAEVRGIRQ